MSAVLWRRTFVTLLVLLVMVVVALVLGWWRRGVVPALVELPVELQARPDQFRDLGVFRGEQVTPPPAAVATTGYSPDGVQRGAEFRDQAWLRAQAPASYTLQILGARDEEAVKQFIAGRAEKEQLRYFQTRREGAPWFVVIYGSFTSRELALGVAGSLDFGLDSRPFPKSFGVIQEELARQDDQPEAVVEPAPNADVVTAPSVVAEPRTTVPESP